MVNCLVKTGFFVLRQCNAKASMRCATCKRPICTKHMVLERKICTECLSQTHEDDSDTDYRELLMRSGGVYSYRRHYYSTYDDIDDIDDLMDGEGFDPEDAEAFDAPSDGAELGDDLGFEDSADLFDS